MIGTEVNNFHAIFASLGAPPSCPGISWKLNLEHHRNGDGDFDKEIIPLLRALNNSEWHTTASCAGHTLREIKTLGKGFYVDVPYRVTVSIHVKATSIDKFMALVLALDSVSGENLWCNLGYRSHDLNNQTEAGYIPFEIIVFAHTKRRRDRLLNLYEDIATLSTQQLANLLRAEFGSSIIQDNLWLRNLPDAVKLKASKTRR